MQKFLKVNFKDPRWFQEFGIGQEEAENLIEQGIKLWNKVLKIVTVLECPGSTTEGTETGTTTAPERDMMLEQFK